MTVYITGAAMLTAQGAGRADVFARLCDGQSGVAPLRYLDPAHFRCQHAYQIKDEAQVAGGAPLRSSAWLAAVIRDAVAEARLDVRASRVVVLVGSGLREQASLELWATSGAGLSLANWDYRAIVQDALGAPVPVYTIVNACSATLHCLAMGRDMLTLDQADAVIVAGADSISASMYGLLDRANSTPPEAIQPFDQHRKGVLMGEGAAAVVLQRQDGRASPDAALARLSAAEMNCDAQHETAPALAGIEAVIRLAHSKAGLSPSQIDLIMAHGTGTPLNDSVESEALARVFGDASGTVMLSGIKAMTGHTAGPSGLISLVCALEILRTGSVPPTPSLTEPIAAARRFDVVIAARHGQSLSRIQIDAFGFGGVNAVAIIERVS